MYIEKILSNVFSQNIASLLKIKKDVSVYTFSSYLYCIMVLYTTLFVLSILY